MKAGSRRGLLVKGAPVAAVVIVSGHAGYRALHRTEPAPNVAATPSAATTADATTGGFAFSAEGAGEKRRTTGVAAHKATPTLEQRLQALRIDPELAAALPPTPATRAFLAAHADHVIQSIGEELNIPQSQRPSYRKLLDDMGKAWMDQRLPEDKVM